MRRLLILTLCAVLAIAASTADAQTKKSGKRRPTVRKSGKKAGKKKSTTKKPKLPPLKTSADKQKFLAIIRDSIPVRRPGSNIR